MNLCHGNGFHLEQDDSKARSELSRRCRNDGGLSTLLGGNVFVLTEDLSKYKTVLEQARSWCIRGLGTMEGEEVQKPKKTKNLPICLQFPMRKFELIEFV